jgi:phosphoribosylanthranilate isomerase
MAKVKICGLSTPEAVEAAIAAGADFIGLVFFAKSPRNVSLPTAKALADRARGRVNIVAMIVDADNPTIQLINDTARPDYFQAHGSETPERVAEIRNLTGKPVIKAVSVATAADVSHAARYAGIAAHILFDAKAPDALLNALPGGNGLAFDWGLLGGSTGFILAGGLNPENVAEAIRITGAPIVDVSSGVEQAPGKKDLALIRKFIERARAAS